MVKKRNGGSGKGVAESGTESDKGASAKDWVDGLVALAEHLRLVHFSLVVMSIAMLVTLKETRGNAPLLEEVQALGTVNQEKLIASLPPPIHDQSVALPSIAWILSMNATKHRLRLPEQVFSQVLLGSASNPVLYQAPPWNSQIMDFSSKLTEVPLYGVVRAWDTYFNAAKLSLSIPNSITVKVRPEGPSIVGEREREPATDEIVTSHVTPPPLTLSGTPESGVPNLISAMTMNQYLSILRLDLASRAYEIQVSIPWSVPVSRDLLNFMGATPKNVKLPNGREVPANNLAVSITMSGLISTVPCIGIDDILDKQSVAAIRARTSSKFLRFSEVFPHLARRFGEERARLITFRSSTQSETTPMDSHSQLMLEEKYVGDRLSHITANSIATHVDGDGAPMDMWGVKMDRSTFVAFGALSVALMLLYLVVHLHVFVVSTKDVPHVVRMVRLKASWIGLYPGFVPRAATLVTAVLIPVLVLAMAVAFSSWWLGITVVGGCCCALWFVFAWRQTWKWNDVAIRG